jgi:very-short-patch-repair endonuclease
MHGNGQVKTTQPSPLRGEGQGEGKHSFARSLRRNQTDAERCLWNLLRAGQVNGLKFRRQHPIGSYIVDFYCATHRLIIELDGGQHAEEAERDALRTRWLNLHGYRVLRFWNHEVLTQSEAVLEAILLAAKNPHPTPLPGREREFPAEIPNTN